MNSNQLNAPNDTKVSQPNTTLPKALKSAPANTSNQICNGTQTTNQQSMNNSQKNGSVSINISPKKPSLSINIQVNSQPSGSSVPSIQNKPIYSS